MWTAASFRRGPDAWETTRAPALDAAPRSSSTSGASRCGSGTPRCRTAAPYHHPEARSLILSRIDARPKEAPKDTPWSGELAGGAQRGPLQELDRLLHARRRLREPPSSPGPRLAATRLSSTAAIPGMSPRCLLGRLPGRCLCFR